MHEDEQAIRTLIRSWHERTIQGDVAGVLSLMSEDAIFLVAGKPAMVGKAAFEKGLRALLAHARIASTAEVEEVLVSGELACARSQASVTVIPHDGGPSTNRRGPILTVFQRSGGGPWLLKRDANLLATEAS